MPLDYITIQNYLGNESTLETVQNTRIAYDDPRFNTTTVMFNEWDINKSKLNGFDNNYNTPAGLISVVTQLKQIYDLPDVSYALFEDDGSLDESDSGSTDYGILLPSALLPDGISRGHWIELRLTALAPPRDDPDRG